MIKKLLAATLSLLILFSLGAATVFAQLEGGIDNPPDGGIDSPCPPGQLCNPFKGPDSLAELLKVIINDILLPVGAVLAVIAFIFVGFSYVTAQGKPAELQKAHNRLLYTSIGTAILLGSWMLATVICKTIGQLGGPICPI